MYQVSLKTPLYHIQMPFWEPFVCQKLLVAPWVLNSVRLNRLEDLWQLTDWSETKFITYINWLLAQRAKVSWCGSDDVSRVFDSRLSEAEVIDSAKEVVNIKTVDLKDFQSRDQDRPLRILAENSNQAISVALYFLEEGFSDLRIDRSCLNYSAKSPDSG
ncbi:MAG: hypothetical protein HRU19_06170 [Pseudobacteriovorax sp.]|nr:hypothetical protein [Pseudobacteriovorax sp.]